jgi:hypothetical protein
MDSLHLRHRSYVVVKVVMWVVDDKCGEIGVMRRRRMLRSLAVIIMIMLLAVAVAEVAF